MPSNTGLSRIRFCDTGPGIAPTEKLFQPLQKGADATGLGLFLSRAFMRSFGGDLRYDPRGRNTGVVSSSSWPYRVRPRQVTGERAQWSGYGFYWWTITRCSGKAWPACSPRSPISRWSPSAAPQPRRSRLLGRSDIDVVLLDFDLGDEQGNQLHIVGAPEPDTRARYSW